jgi:hypothetical protein
VVKPPDPHIGRVTGGRTSPLNSTLTQEIWDAIAETNVIVFINFGTTFTRKKVLVTKPGASVCWFSDFVSRFQNALKLTYEHPQVKKFV